MSSAAAFTRLAVLENPRIIQKTKTVVFDLQAYLPSSEPALIGSIRYFNADNLEFPEVGCYAVWISVARTLPTVEVYSQSLGPTSTCKAVKGLYGGSNLIQDSSNLATAYISCDMHSNNRHVYP
ncbi:hypothetical protein B0H13DRAFT_1851438 [Mycena leptocephala]|nr:hypothetical protein B0H13DRAFT_1851438 [Mycena leptocephala]